MFGYIKLDGYASAKYRDYFKRNYCFLCRSLDQHYGFFSRLFVSYDVTFFTVLFSPDNYLASTGKIRCFGARSVLRERLRDDYSRKIAALNLALAAGDLKDKVNDKDRFYAKPLYGAYRRVFGRVKRDYPRLWEIIEQGHAQMNAVEDRNGPIEEIEDCFAALVGAIAREVFSIEDEERIAILQYVAKMLYFMDAVDDIDKDVKRGSYNGLKSFGSKKEYVFKHHGHLKAHLDRLREGLPACVGDSVNAGVINRILDFGIPDTVVKVCFKGVEV